MVPIVNKYVYFKDIKDSKIIFYHEFKLKTFIKNNKFNKYLKKFSLFIDIMHIHTDIMNSYIFWSNAVLK